MYLRSLATANPPLHISQSEAYGHYCRLFDLTVDEDALYRRLLLEGPIEGRFVGMDSAEEGTETDPDQLNARFLRFARQTASQAARQAMNQAAVAPHEIGALLVNTCTGYLCPGLSSYVAEEIGLSRDIFPLDIAGMGCGGALPNLKSAAGLLALDTGKAALSVAVEICSATLFMGPDPGLIVSNSIFGDGAAAAVLVADEHPLTAMAPLKFLAFSSVQYPEYREQLRYRQEGGRLKNQLTVKVPALSAKLGKRVLEQLLGPRHLTGSDIAWWAVHAGGTAVLEKVGEKLGLPASDLHHSMEVFRRYGNMSSPSVMFALQNILRDGKPKAGELGVLMAFGAGLTAFAALVEFSGSPCDGESRATFPLR